MSATDAMRELAQARPAVWLKLKEQEAAIRSEQEQAQESLGHGKEVPRPTEGAFANNTDEADARGANDDGQRRTVGSSIRQQKDETTGLMQQAMGAIEKQVGDI
eukprot:COSAG02_NODE_18162_length_956_cov_2.183197_1_plen_104_part_00